MCVCIYVLIYIYVHYLEYIVSTIYNIGQFSLKGKLFI